jgi:hypothetical protein
MALQLTESGFILILLVTQLTGRTVTARTVSVFTVSVFTRDSDRHCGGAVPQVSEAALPGPGRGSAAAAAGDRSG